MLKIEFFSPAEAQSRPYGRLLLDEVKCMQNERTFNVWWQMLGIFYMPRATFQEINKHPNWLLPFLAVLLLNAGFSYLFFSSGVPVSGRIMLYSGYAIGAAFSLLVSSGVFLLCLYIQSAQVSFKKVLSVVTHTYFIYTLISVVLGTLILKLSPASSGIDPFNPILSNPGILVNPQLHPALYRLASSFDLLSLYFLIMTALGFSIIAKKISFKGAMMTVMTVWSFYIGALVLIKAVVT
jgi:hypothetical protein